MGDMAGFYLEEGEVKSLVDGLGAEIEFTDLDEEGYD